MSFSFPPATKFTPNSRNDAFLRGETRFRFSGETGSPRSSARSRTIYLNFAFIVALRDYLYHTRVSSCAALPCASNSDPSQRAHARL